MSSSSSVSALLAFPVVERGFVVIVANAKPDEEVTIEIDTVQSNVAFASIRERRE
ncbi:TRAM domain-containing protein [Halalkalicoccus subterraneus]|uniref:TRAM domain-containing protein n=1 Tax=Halalkalicoccus subterraneus TaxID=2675002 RepID=UPI000EFA9DAB